MSFIEVTTKQGEILSINADYILSIQDNVIEVAVSDGLGKEFMQNRYIHCVDNYAVLKKKIQEATKKNV